MKSKKLFLACALTVLTSSYAAFAEEASTMCSNPLKTICTDTLTARKDREKYINGIKAEISKEAQVSAGPRIEEMKKKIKRYRIFKRFGETLKINNQEIMKAAKKRMNGIESIITNEENITLLKSYMKQAIDETNFDALTKVNFKSTVDSIIIGNFEDFLNRTGLEDNVFAHLINNPCGLDGLVDNAFATTLGKDRYVLICPGFLISSTLTADVKERLDSILQAIAHEMGHHVDSSKVTNSTYKPYLTCISENYADKFNKTKDDEKFCNTKKDDAAACKMKVTESHAGELVADAWGLKVLSIHSKTQNYSSADTDGLLTNSWSKLCGSGDEGVHPSGDFRIGTSMRTNPDINLILACDNSTINTKPACTFDGAVNF